jgi:hypothetical protein
MHSSAGTTTDPGYSEKATVHRGERPPALWLRLANIHALLHPVAVAAGQQQSEGDDC